MQGELLVAMGHRRKQKTDLSHHNHQGVGAESSGMRCVHERNRFDISHCKGAEYTGSVECYVVDCPSCC